MNKDERIHELETLLSQKHRCDCGDSEACALVRRIAKLEEAFDDQTRELNIALDVMTEEQRVEYRHRAYPTLYPR